MRVLFAGLTSPYPPTNGHRLRTWALLRALVEDGHAVTSVSLADSAERVDDLEPLKRLCRNVEIIPAPARVTTERESLKRLRALASPLPFGAWKFRSAAFTGALRRHLAAERFDLVLCDGIYNVQNLPDTGPVPVMLNKDDVAHLIIERYLALERRLPLRLYGALELTKVRRWEQATCRRCAGILACSDHDRRLLETLAPEARIVVVPNVVDTIHYAPDGAGEPRTVLFQGGMEWHPNRDAVEFFVREALPALRRLVPDAIFRVAGRCPSDGFRSRLERMAGVEFTGTVPDMRDEIARAAVCVVPLRIGSGTRMKILEAAAMGKPIVSTTLGAEGLVFKNRDEILLADTPGDLAQATASLLLDDRRRATVGGAAREVVERHYSFPVLRRSLAAALALVSA